MYMSSLLSFAQVITCLRGNKPQALDLDGTSTAFNADVARWGLSCLQAMWRDIDVMRHARSNARSAEKAWISVGWWSVGKSVQVWKLTSSYEVEAQPEGMHIAILNDE